MSWKYYFVCVCAFLLAASVQGQAITLDSCYNRALVNYPLVKQYGLIEKTKEYTLSNARKAYLPQVSITAIGGYVLGLPEPGAPGGGTGGDLQFISLASMRQAIWDGGATKTQKQIIEAASETDKAAVALQLYQLRSRVNQLFFGMLLTGEQLQQLQAQDSLLQHNLNRLQQLYANGLAYTTDIDELRVERLRLGQQQIAYAYTRKGYAAMLALLTGLPIHEQSVLQKPLALNPAQDSLVRRPEVALYKSQRELVQAQAGMQRVSLMPKLGVMAAGVLLAPGLNLGGIELASLGVAGVSASWNISGLYKNRNEKNLTQQALNKITVQEETFLFNTHIEMQQAAAAIESQRATLNTDKEIVQLRQTIREGYQQKYTNGSGPLHDLLLATDKESEAKALKALHEMQLLMALYEYNTITGN